MQPELPNLKPRPLQRLPNLSLLLLHHHLLLLQDDGVHQGALRHALQAGDELRRPDLHSVPVVGEEHEVEGGGGVEDDGGAVPGAVLLPPGQGLTS